MKLLFKQRFFSWLDSYDVYDEAGNTVFTVKGQIAFGHMLKIYDANGNERGYLKERVLSWLPRFDMYIDGVEVGRIKKEFTFIRPKFNIEYMGWHIEGNWYEWDYQIINSRNLSIAEISKQIWNLTDTYSINVHNPNDALSVLMLVLAIDAEKCSRRN